MLKSIKQQQGVVIVVALFIVALVATMSYVMLARLARDTERTALILRHTDAEFYAAGGVAWAMDTLRTNWETKKPNQLIDAMPIQAATKVINGYQIENKIEDMQARFNLNNVSDRTGETNFIYLLRAVDPILEETNAVQIADALLDWLKPGGSDGESAQYYFQLPAPYRAAHRAMVSASELRMVKGMTPALFQAVQPYVTALPQNVFINVQTASAPVLMSLAQGITREAANAIVMARKQKPFLTVDEFAGLDIVSNFSIPKDKITVTSRYFLLETTVTIEKQRAVLYTLLERVTAERKATVTILWQSKGSL